MSVLQPESVDVHVEISGETVLAGRAAFSYRGATFSTEFIYDQSYLRRRGAYELDPALPLVRSVSVTNGLPAAFADSTPDWWGRQLVSRAARLEARSRGEQQPLLTEADFLVGVSDAARQGSLRFAASGTSSFLDPSGTVPALIGLPSLLEASDAVLAEDDASVAEALKTLLAAGSGTLGGARPKASVRDGERLLVAKFPFREDEWDVMAWEKTALDLAARVGLTVPERRLVEVGSRHVLLLERFDRDRSGRVGYASARTMSETASSAGNDYLDLVAAIEDHSGEVTSDLHELWTRVALTVALNNTDDHFHNHGFLRTARGWSLAPVFDINIDPQLAHLRTTTLAGAARRDDSLRALVASAEYFGMSDDQAREGLRGVADAVANWRDLARSNGVPGGEFDRVGWVLDDFCDRVAGRVG